MPRFFAGLDLGQSADYTALTIADRITTGEKRAYHIRHLQRFKLGTPYPQIVKVVNALTLNVKDMELAIDATGVGAAVVDMFNVAKLSCPSYAIYIHGGDKVTREGNKYRVPKRDLVSVVQVLLQNGALKIAEDLAEAKTLVKELLNFKVTIDPVTAHDSYAAWRENAHDDLVLATAMATWTAEKLPSHRPMAGVWS